MMNKKDPKLEEEIDELNDLTRTRIKQESLIMSFFKGILRALGWVFGLALVIAITLFVLSRYQHIPVIGQFFKYVESALQLN